MKVILFSSGETGDTPMKIIVSKIPDEGVEIHSIETARSLGITPSDLILDGDVHIDAMVSRQEGIFVDAALRTALHINCSRCR